MKTKAFLSASRLAIMALALSVSFCFTACGSDDDEILSGETTPTDFQLKDYYNRYEKYFLFDYAGSRYVGSDTISSNKCSVELRQGKHHLIWINGLDGELGYMNRQNQGHDVYSAGIHYDPLKKTVTNYGYVSYRNITYAELDLNVTAYLTSTHQVRCSNYIGGSIQVQITDMSDEIEQPRDMTGDEGYNYTSMYKYSRPLVGIIEGYPVIREVSLTGNDFVRDGKTSCDIIHQYHGDEIGKREFYIQPLSIFCPKAGINDVQLTVTVKDKYGKEILSRSLPRCSVQRGNTTVLRGPIFSGSTADWTVTMEPY